MKKLLILAILIIAALFTGCANSNQEQATQDMQQNTTSEADKTIADGDNPIDKDFNEKFDKSLTTAEMSLTSGLYLRAWEYELKNILRLNNKESEFDKIQEEAKKVAEKEFAKFEGGTGGAPAGLLAQAEAYKSSALKLISENKDYEYLYTNDYIPLLDAIAFSEVVHYQSFTEQPDEYTANLVMSDMVAHQQIFIGKDKLTADDGVIYFSKVNEQGEEGVTPEQLYSDFFAKGEYSYPPDNLSPVIGTQYGIGIVLSDPPISELYIITEMKWEDNKLELQIDLSSISNGDGNKTNLGLATVVLERDKTSSCGFKIISFVPEYEAFDDFI